jgi:peptide methionine sulfoxide reductase MsrA
MFKLFNILSSSEEIVEESVKAVCVYSTMYNENKLDIYTSLNNPHLKINDLMKILKSPLESKNILVDNDSVIDIIFKCRNKQVSTDFFKWYHNFLTSCIKNKSTVSYEEIEKIGHIYVLQCDGGIKVGKTKNDVKKRIKGLQTGNVEDIKILYDFETSNADLLERYIHYILQRYRCNSNREFFDCDVQYIINVVNMSGIVLDTLKSTFDQISQEEVVHKISEKLQIPITMAPRKQDEMGSSLSSSVSSIEVDVLDLVEVELMDKLDIWMKKNIVSKENNLLKIEDVVNGFHEKVMSPVRMRSYIPIVEKHLGILVTEYKGKGKGWKNFSIKV